MTFSVPSPSSRPLLDFAGKANPKRPRAWGNRSNAHEAHWGQRESTTSRSLALSSNQTSSFIMVSTKWASPWWSKRFCSLWRMQIRRRIGKYMQCAPRSARTSQIAKNSCSAPISNRHIKCTCSGTQNGMAGFATVSFRGWDLGHKQTCISVE